ncbi:MAG: UDP-N-acetylmuramoyl-tripeptide--D-alanyl-D-alanine ligase [Lachnospiraceae bacterium]|nr:UDP-N-acetylmuramoyl-tripeptide--D-alanyl-D-alanine ligase [Lachnospiraceae bacterium]
MKNMTLRRIAEACGGILHGKNGMEDAEVASVVTDSRQAKEGALFAAIKGERVDGHRFIPAVFEQGAVCVLSEQELPEDTAGSWIKVISTLGALKDIAEYYLRQLNIPVVGITGSVGKTSTKEVVAAVLSQKYRTLKTQGNFNNELGLPLTVFRLREEDEMAVLEMGISNFGEMHRLAKIARPDTCVITNIGQCHLEYLHSRDGILQAKTEIFDFLRPDGHIILNGNDDKLILVKNVNGIEPVFFGLKPEKDGHPEEAPALSVWADEIKSRGLKGVSCRIHTPDGSISVRIPIPGQHMVYNALAAAAVGLTYGLSPEQIRAGIESLQPVSGRFHIIETENYMIIDDCYNANPVSMKASLEVLQDGAGRRVAILGDMGELGENEALLHEEVGAFAGSCRIDKLIGVGPLCAGLIRKAGEENSELELSHYDTPEELLDCLEEQVQAGDTILVKASHFMNFSRIVDALQKMG